MAKKSSRKKVARKAVRPKKRGATRPTADKGGTATTAFVNKSMHDFTNLATAVRAYLELLSSQGRLDEKQQYYIARAREQVEMMVKLVREMKEKLV